MLIPQPAGAVVHAVDINVRIVPLGRWRAVPARAPRPGPALANGRRRNHDQLDRREAPSVPVVSHRETSVDAGAEGARFVGVSRQGEQVPWDALATCW